MEGLTATRLVRQQQALPLGADLPVHPVTVDQPTPVIHEGDQYTAYPGYHPDQPHFLVADRSEERLRRPVTTRRRSGRRRWRSAVWWPPGTCSATPWAASSTAIKDKALAAGSTMTAATGVQTKAAATGVPALAGSDRGLLGEPQHKSSLNPLVRLGLI